MLAHARLGNDTAAIARGLAQLDSILRGQRLDSMRLIGANEFDSGGIERLTLTYEMRATRGWLGATVTTMDSAATWAILGIHVEPLRGELSRLNAFTLSDRSAAQYLGLAAVVVLTAFTLGVAIFLATRRQFPKRWRWVFLSLLGVGAVYVNWTTGDVSSSFAMVQLFAASAVRPNEFSPWVLSFSFPLGAVIALSRYRSWWSSGREVAPPLESTTAPPSAEAAT